MQCHKCGTENPTHNNFCGHCGAVLIRQPLSIFDGVEGDGAAETPLLKEPRQTAAVTVVPEPEPEQAAEHDYTRISGPSFLGLADEDGGDSSEYLLEEDRPRGRGGRIAFSLIALLVVVGVGFVILRAMKAGGFSLAKLANSSSTAKSAEDPVASPGDASATGGVSTKATEGPPAMGALQEDASSHPSANAPGAAPGAAATDQDASQRGSTSPKEEAAVKQDSSEQRSDGDEVPERSSKASRAKPSAREVAITKPEDPRQNKMLLDGEKYLYGRGVARNCQQAMVYFRAAAKENNIPAMSHLGALYETGECVPQNRMTAYSWFARAHSSDPKNTWIEKNMDMLWRDMTARERAVVSK